MTIIYKAHRFDTIYYLKDFLNDNKIKPTDIVGIYREHKYQDQGFFDLLYVERAESEDKCKSCEYYRNPDYTRCHECKAESEERA